MTEDHMQNADQNIRISLTPGGPNLDEYVDDSGRWPIAVRDNW